MAYALFPKGGGSMVLGPYSTKKQADHANKYGFYVARKLTTKPSQTSRKRTPTKKRKLFGFF